MAMRVGELARRTGVGVSTLRAWETRYQFPVPERSAAGHRLYDERDVERVDAVVRLVGEGLTLSAAVARVAMVGTGALPDGEGEALLHGQILEVAQVGIWVSRDGRTRYANPRMAEIMGYRLEDLVGIPVLDFFEPDQLPRVRELTTIVREGHPIRVRPRLRRADGSTFLAELHTRPLVDQAGRYAGAVAVVEDVSDRVRDQRLAQLQAHLLDAMDVAGVVAAPDATILHVNAAAERLFGWPMPDLVGRDALEVLVPPQSSELANDLYATVAGGRPYAGRIWAARQDGSTFAARSSATVVLDHDGATLGFVATVRDQSEQERVRRDLRRREVQAEAVAVLGAEALRAAGESAAVLAVLAECVATARRLLRADHAAVFAPGAEAVAGCRVAVPDPQRAAAPPLSIALAGVVTSVRQSVLVHDAAVDPRFEPGTTGSAVGAPIHRPGGVAGALVASSSSPARFHATTLQFVQSMANIVGGLLLASGEPAAVR